MFRLAVRVACTWLAGASVVAAASPARADERDSDARVDYRAPPACPTVASLVDGVTARLPRFRVAAGAARRFDVEVRAVDDRFVGRLASLDVEGSRTEREVVGDSCEDVVDALGLVLAIAIDPGAALTRAAALTSPEAPLVEGRAAPRPGGERDERNERDERAERAPEHTWAAGAGFTSTVGEIDVRMLGATAFVERAIDLRSWRPIVRAGMTRAGSETIDVNGHGSARFTWTVGTLDFCPVLWGGERLSLTPCVRVDAGSIAGQGSNIAHPHDDARLWVDAAAVARGEWGIVSPVFLRIEGGLFVPITRPRFHFDSPDVTIASPSPVGAIATLYMGSHFP